MTLLAFFSPSVQTAAILAAGLTILGTLAFFQKELSVEWRRQALHLADLGGIGLCIAGLAAGSKTVAITAIAYVALVLVTTGLALLAESRLYPSSLLNRLRRDPRGRTATAAYAGGLVLLVGTGVVIGILVADEEEPRPEAFFSSEYRVSGTCADGSCVLNECEEPAPCGLENEGRIHEGEPVDIVCQAKGEMVTSPDNHRSEIWDRLPSGLYVSDLFVEGTAANRFTPDLPRCAVT